MLIRDATGVRTDGDDAAATSGHHPRRHRPAEPEDPAGVDVQHLGPVLVGEVRDRTGAQDAGDVDQQADGPEVGLGTGDDVRDGGRVAHIGQITVHVRTIREVRHGRVVDRRTRHRQRPRRTTTEPIRRGTGHDRDGAG
jgi:hypothetical protein